MTDPNLYGSYEEYVEAQRQKEKMRIQELIDAGARCLGTCLECFHHHFINADVGEFCINVDCPCEEKMKVFN